MSASQSSEINALRALVHAAVGSFEFQGPFDSDTSPKDILLEVLLCAQSDFNVIGDASHTGGGVVDSMVFRRAELRIDLGIALAEYCEKFGWPEEPVDEETSEALNGGES